MIELITTLADGSRYVLDVNRASPIALSKTFLELSDITKRKGDFSRSFDLPRTPRNDYYFGLFGDPSSIGVAWTPQVLTECWLLEDSNIVIEGVLKLVSTDREHTKYTVSISGAVATIKDAIGDKGMNDLDLSAWVYQVSNIQTSWDGSLWSGDMIFSINDFGFGMGLYKKKNAGNVLIDITDATCADGIILEETLPAFRLNELLRKIFTEAGFVVGGSWFSETDVEEIYVQSDNPLSPYFDSPNSWKTKMGADLALLAGDQTIPLIADPPIGEWNDTLYEYTAATAGSYLFGYRVEPTAGTPLTTNLTLSFQVNAITVYGFGFQWDAATEGTRSITMAAGDTFRLRIKHDGTAATQGFVNIGSNTFLELLSVLPTGVFVDPSEHLANYKQIDFLREVIGVFNLIVWKPSTGEVRLDTWDYYMANYGSKKDWTDKVDLTDLPKIFPINSELTNPINLELKPSPDILNDEYIRVTGRSYGAYREDTRIPFTQPPQEPFKIFAPAPYQEIYSIVAGAQNTDMVIGKFYPSEDDLSFKPPGLQLLYYCGTFTIGASTPFYTKDTAASGCINRLYFPVFSPFKLTAGAPPYGGTDWRVQSNTLDLNFAWFTPPSSIVDNPTTENLYNRYFREMLRERYDEANKIIRFRAILTPEDIANFNFADTIVINLNGTPVGLKILEINNYSPNIVKSTEIKAMITFIK